MLLERVHLKESIQRLIKQVSATYASGIKFDRGYSSLDIDKHAQRHKFV